MLASFAVPRGPSLDPAEKRLAVRTEDHPFEYLDFEAVIPEKSYGAGPMILWDRGRVEYLEAPVEAGIERGKIDFMLEGHKLRGRFALVRMKGPGKDKEWLLLKKSDAFASPGGARDPVRDSPRSVLSGLTVEELGSAAYRCLPRSPRGRARRHPGNGGRARAGAHAVRLGGRPRGGPGVALRAQAQRRPRPLPQGRGGRPHRRPQAPRRDPPPTPRSARAVAALPPPASSSTAESWPRAATAAPASTASRSASTSRSRTRCASPRARSPSSSSPSTSSPWARATSPRSPSPPARSCSSPSSPPPAWSAPSNHVEDDAGPLLAFCAEHDLEGVVAKRAGSPYRAGPRARRRLGEDEAHPRRQLRRGRLHPWGGRAGAARARWTSRASVRRRGW